ncbi:MAG: hypothetical protein DVB31_06600 [Verrucomicrobia bacterium]|nr:MAG: hypothetical protein DVB31_06600 [Verrucomicrobiota bacterium]
MSPRSALRLAVACLASWLLRAADPAPPALAVARPNHPGPVDFDREILPILQGNCLPCHNKTTTKADLLLETPADMLKGGETGPALVPGKSAESLLFKLSAHQSKPRMPPKDNKVNATNLRPEELGLLALWIDQGARASERRHVEIAWNPLPPGLQPIYSAAISADGLFAVAGRGNQLFVHQTSHTNPLVRLDDPALAKGGQPAAHRDLVDSVAISPDGEWIASGSYREIKLWQRTPSVPHAGKGGGAAQGTNGFPARALAAPDGKRRLEWSTNHVLRLVLPEGQGAVDLVPRFVSPLEQPARIRQLAKSDAEFAKGRVENTTKEAEAQTTRLAKATEALGTARREADAKSAAEARARTELSIAEASLARLERTKAPTDAVKAAKERVDKAKPLVDPAAAESTKAAIRASTAEEELRLADLSLGRASTQKLVSQRLLAEATTRLAGAETRPAPSAKWPRPPLAAAWSPDGSFVAAAFADSVHVWSVANGALVASAMDDEAAKDGRLAFRAEAVLGIGTSGIWSFLPRWELRHALGSGDDQSPIADRVNALAFRADGRRLASGSGEPTRSGEIRVWEPWSGTELFAMTNLHSDAVLALAFSPDGMRLASGGADRFARIIDLATGRQSAALEGHTGHVLALSWRADGRVLASAGADYSVKFWQLATGEKAKTVAGFPKEITGVAHLGTEGDIVVASGENELRRVTESGEKPASYEGGRDFNYSLAATPDGRWIVSGGQDGVLRLWDVQTAKLAREFR